MKGYVLAIKSRVLATERGFFRVAIVVNNGPVQKLECIHPIFGFYSLN
jgi:hypothetical protein